MAKRKKKKAAANNGACSVMEYLQNERRYYRNEIEETLHGIKEEQDENVYKSALRKCIETTAQANLTAYNKNKTLKDKGFDFKTDNVYQKRRKEAVANLAPVFADKFRNISEVSHIEEVFIGFNMGIISINPDEIERGGYVTLACASFILDELKENGSLMDALCFIPQGNTTYWELPRINYFDFRYSNDIIFGMLELIYLRNVDQLSASLQQYTQPFLTPEAARRKADSVEPLTTRDVLNKDHKDYLKHRQELIDQANQMTYRERFNRILEYMRPSIIARAEERFKNAADTFFFNVLNGFKKYEDARQEKIEEARECIDKAIAARERFEKNYPDSSTTTRDDAISASIMKIIHSSQANPTLRSIKSTLESEYEHYNLLARDYNTKMEKVFDLENEMDDMLEECQKYLMNASNIGFYETMFDNKDESQKLVNTPIINPFEICFAYLWLVDRGSDIPWLVPLSSSIVNLAYKRLPWEGIRNKELINRIHGERDNKEEEPEQESQNQSQDNTEDVVADVVSEDSLSEEPTELEESKFIERNPQWDELSSDITQETTFFENKYTDYLCWKTQGIEDVDETKLLHWNFPQFIYALTGISVPRNADAFINDSDSFIKSGFKETDLDLLRAYLNLLVEFNTRVRSTSVYGDDRDFSMPAEASCSQSDVDKLKNTLAEKSQKITELKASLKEAKADAEYERTKSEAMQKEFEQNKKELVELRELVYNLQNGQSCEDLISDATDVQFPYTPKKRIVICGGHISWLQVIRDLLPSVRIIEPDTNPDVNVIRNADVVWLQTNAMSHAFYEKIMAVVRQNKTSLKYFAFASAEKCARQLVADEQ